jgi:hypothetical protein
MSIPQNQALEALKSPVTMRCWALERCFPMPERMSYQ